jgi:adenylosuccinate synthase
VRKAKTYKSLPENAKKFLAFLERRLKVPIVAVTTGPARDNYIKIPS